MYALLPKAQERTRLSADNKRRGLRRVQTVMHLLVCAPIFNLGVLLYLSCHVGVTNILLILYKAT
jgi:hypothetical protein